MDALRAVKGMNDILPGEMARWRFVEERFREVTALYGFGEVRPPLVEPTALFVRSIGDTTDIVEKEMYSFVDKGDRSLTLRPEGTASIVRAYVQHSVHAQEPVTRWIYLGPMYRRERPAKGRYRQFYQLGAEIYGDAGPTSDAELIEMLVRYLTAVGIQDVDVRLNSLGSGECRSRYRKALLGYLTPKRDLLSQDSQRRLDTNPLRVLDSKAPQDQEVTEGAPSILDFLSPDDQAHFSGVCAGLDALGTPYMLDTKLVRGLDYYMRTSFELRTRSDALGSQDAICGGGRYDGLVEALGGPKTPAIGFAIGIERVLMLSQQAGEVPRPCAFVLAAAPSMHGPAAVLARDLRDAGLRAEVDARGTSLKSQLRRANKMGARVAFILGEDEHGRGVVQLRDLAASEQTEVPRAEAVARAQKLLR